MGLLISLLSSSLQQCWDLGSQISLLSLHLYDGVVVVGFVGVSGFWLGSVVKDLGFVVGWLWRFVGFGLDRWFWVYCGVVGGRWSHINGFMGFDDANEVVLLMVDGFGFVGFAYAGAIVLLMG